MDGIGNLSGWRWIFILEGIATVLIAFVSWIFMPADLRSAKFFTDEERAFASECLLLFSFLDNSGLCLILVSVHRFREAQSVVSGAPLSEPAQKMVATDDEPIKDLEKETESRIETRAVEGTVVHEEDEQFEWREVVRGALTHSGSGRRQTR